MQNETFRLYEQIGYFVRSALEKTGSTPGGGWLHCEWQSPMGKGQITDFSLVPSQQRQDDIGN